MLCFLLIVSSSYVCFFTYGGNGVCFVCLFCFCFGLGFFLVMRIVEITLVCTDFSVNSYAGRFCYISFYICLLFCCYV